jgi:hypothetical protein
MYVVATFVVLGACAIGAEAAAPTATPAPIADHK